MTSSSFLVDFLDSSHQDLSIEGQKSIIKATSSSLSYNIQNRVFCSFLKMSFFKLQNTQPVAKKISAKNPEAGVSTLGDRQFIRH